MIKNNNFKKQKKFSLVIAAFHFFISLFFFGKGFLIIFNLSNKFAGEISKPVAFWLTIAFCIVSISLLLMLLKLKNKYLQINELKKITNSLNLQCIFGILFSFYYGGHLFFNENQTITGALILSMIIVEIIYLILSSKFIKITEKVTS